MGKNPKSDLQPATDSPGLSGEAGSTLTEMILAISIMSIVGVGAYVVMTSTITSQAMLEKTIEKGFAQFNYKNNHYRYDLPFSHLQTGRRGFDCPRAMLMMKTVN